MYKKVQEIQHYGIVLSADTEVTRIGEQIRYYYRIVWKYK